MAIVVDLAVAKVPVADAGKIEIAVSRGEAFVEAINLVGIQRAGPGGAVATVLATEVAEGIIAKIAGEAARVVAIERGEGDGAVRDLLVAEWRRAGIAVVITFYVREQVAHGGMTQGGKSYEGKGEERFYHTCLFNLQLKTIIAATMPIIWTLFKLFIYNYLNS